MSYRERDLPPEHPRASSTDDVKGIIPLFHEVMGDNFDLKQFYDEFPKVMTEFVKRIDPDLSFFYWTGHQTRSEPLRYRPSISLRRVESKDWTKFSFPEGEIQGYS